MLWVLKRTVSMRQFFWVTQTNVKMDGLENIHNFMLKCFASLDLWLYNILTPGWKLAIGKPSPTPMVALYGSIIEL